MNVKSIIAQAASTVFIVLLVAAIIFPTAGIGQLVLGVSLAIGALFTVGLVALCVYEVMTDKASNREQELQAKIDRLEAKLQQVHDNDLKLDREVRLTSRLRRNRSLLSKALVVSASLAWMVTHLLRSQRIGKR